MCSKTDNEVQAQDLALQQSQMAMNKQLNDAYLSSFARQQSVLGQQQAKLSYMQANPMGYTPAQLKIQTSGVNENFARAAKNALGSAAAFAAAHGSSDIGGGATGEIAGQIGASVGAGKAQALSDIAQQSESLKQQNFWKATEGLNQVGAEYGGSAGTAIGGANAAAESATGAGSGAVAASTAASQETAGLISGIGGLATGIIGANPKGIFN